ncbi:sulfotransferase family protein [Streptomyces sp. NPDC058157]|uniref:sulfotransferase family protein n=1 Tax=Streptomyces sp. NPDC058157 TaxID=3346360 RepID=UPI0036E1A7D5
MGDDVLLRQLTKERLMEEAADRTGLSDFGETGFEEGLDVLLASLHKTVDALSPYGRTCARGMPLAALENRLHLTENLRRNPDIAQTEIREPVFILGLPRSGTTLLHNLLSLHPALRAPLFWELQSPATPRGQSREDLIRNTRAGLELQHRNTPSFRSIHLQSAEGPEECTWLLMNELRSFLFAFCFDVPDYVQWLLSTGMESAIRSHRSQLQRILWRRPGGTLVLKDPYHALNLNEINTVYGDARYIHLHRDPAEVLGSLCSLNESVRKLSYENQPVHTYGAELGALIKRLLVAQQEFQQANAVDGRSLDIAYSRLAADPVGTACTIMEFLKLEVTAETERRLTEHVAEFHQHKYGVHRYSLDRFCVDEEELVRELRDVAAGNPAGRTW